MGLKYWDPLIILVYLDKPKFKMIMFGESLDKLIGFPPNHLDNAINYILLTLEHPLVMSWIMKPEGSLQQWEDEILSFGHS